MIYLMIIVLVITILRMMVGSYAQCPPGHLYLPYLVTQYQGDELQNHSILVTKGQNKTISCSIQCSNVDLRGCDIVVDWLVINPHTYRIYFINSNDRQTFQQEFGMDFVFSSLTDSLHLCSSNGVSNLNFSVTLVNFNVSLQELLVICGIKRIVSGSASYAIKQFALLKQNPTTGTEEPTGGAVTTTTNVWSSFHFWLTTTSAATVISGYISGWPDSASATTVVVLLIVIVVEFIALLFAIYVIKKRVQVDAQGVDN